MPDFVRDVSASRSRMVELQHGANVLTEEAEIAAVK
jgi:hypothetical protein